MILNDPSKPSILLNVRSVVGAASGIGKAVCEVFVAEGGQVAATDNNAELLKTAFAGSNSKGQFVIRNV